MPSAADPATPAANPLRASIVTPVYNARAYIAETIDSVLAQEGPPFEYIVVDDGSTDGSGDFIAQRYGERVRLIRQDNAGEAAAVNRGVAAARADIVAVVNADDPVLPGLLKTAVTALEEEIGLVAVYPDWRMIDERGHTVREMRTLDWDLAVHLGQHLCLPGPGAFFRKSALGDETPRNPAYRYTGDYEMWLRLALRGGIRRLPEILATWRFHDAGASVAARNPEMAANKVEMIEAFFRRPDLPPQIALLRGQALSSACYCAGLLAIHDTAIPGRRYMMRSLLLRPVWPRRFRPERRRSWLRIGFVLASPVGQKVVAALRSTFKPQRIDARTRESA